VTGPGVRRSLSPLQLKGTIMNQLSTLPSAPARNTMAAMATDRRLVGAAVITAVVGMLLAAGGCSPHHTAPAPAASPAPSTAAPPGAAYLAIATADNERLDTAFDHLDGRDRADLGAARADLRAIAATERDFDRRIARLALPPGASACAKTLTRANEARADLTARAATSPSLKQLHSLRGQLNAANTPVEHAVTALRADLGLPRPDTH